MIRRETVVPVVVEVLPPREMSELASVVSGVASVLSIEVSATFSEKTVVLVLAVVLGKFVSVV